MNRTLNTIRNLSALFHNHRRTHWLLTPKEASKIIEVRTAMAHQLNREELETERKQYMEACKRLTQVILEYRRSRKIVRIEVEFDEQMFVNHTPYTLAVIAETIAEAAKVKWEAKQ